MVKNLEKELALLKQELAIHDSLVRGRAWGQDWVHRGEGQGAEAGRWQEDEGQGVGAAGWGTRQT